MKEYKRITILLKDSPDHNDYNKRILEYLNDRHQNLNDVGYVIAIEVVDNTNINSFISAGITSIPALLLDNDMEYGVNSIISTLAKLEITNITPMNSGFKNNTDNSNDTFRDLIMEEMLAGEQETDGGGASSIKPKHQDYPEEAMSSKDIDQKMTKYEAIYKAREKSNPKRNNNKIPSIAVSNIPTAKQNVEKLIAEKNYDKR
jgi:hypothetical protein